MTESKGFDLAALLGGVSKLDTGGEQIVRLPLELLDPDPDNFYSLDGLDELAANIETVGLLDPIRVRPNGERYTVVSGHRRRAAIQMIRDGGSEQFAAGVPCIVEYGEASDAMRKLRLIYANSATRQLTSAEQSRQAEEVTSLLYELKEQGVEFPGRMRDHVAQACNTTKSKLARLHAIRSNAQEYVLDAYDSGEINESVAYELQKLPRDAQKTYIVAREHACLRLDVLTAEEIRQYDEMQSKIMGLRCTASEVRGSVWDKHPLCPIRQDRLEEALRQINGYIPADGCKHPIGTRGNCVKGKCCRGCPELLDCEVRCQYSEDEVTRREAEAAERQEATQAERERKQAEFEAARAAHTAAHERLEAEKKESTAGFWARVQTAATATGVGVYDALLKVFDEETAEEGSAYASGDVTDASELAEHILSDFVVEVADALGCSMDYLFGQTAEPLLRDSGGDVLCRESETPEPPAAAWPTVWQTGTPDKEGWYAVRGVWADDDTGITLQEFLYWRGAWYENANEADRARQQTYVAVQRFFPLPEEVTE